jgi:hypothetical protein
MRKRDRQNLFCSESVKPKKPRQDVRTTVERRAAIVKLKKKKTFPCCSSMHALCRQCGCNEKVCDKLPYVGEAASNRLCLQTGVFLICPVCLTVLTAGKRYQVYPQKACDLQCVIGQGYGITITHL